jgi:hypothetical protein
MIDRYRNPGSHKSQNRTHRVAEICPNSHNISPDPDVQGRAAIFGRRDDGLSTDIRLEVVDGEAV